MESRANKQVDECGPLFLVDLRKLLLQVFHFWRIVDGDVPIVRMKGRIVLVIAFCRVKTFQRHNLRYDVARENSRLVQLWDVRVCDPLLFISTVKDRGAILVSSIRALAVELRRIVRDREKYLQQLPVRDL